MFAIDREPIESEQSAAQVRILIVDSDPDLRNVLLGCLLELGYEVACAAGPDEAVRLVANALHEENRFSVVILDIAERESAAILDAFTLIARLDPELRVVATSTFPYATWLVDHASFGFAAALAKPWRFVELATTLERVLADGEARKYSEARIKIREDVDDDDDIDDDDAQSA
jgi:DNA-binding NtrC family response regulator